MKQITVLEAEPGLETGAPAAKVASGPVFVFVSHPPYERMLLNEE